MRLTFSLTLLTYIDKTKGWCLSGGVITIKAIPTPAIPAHSQNQRCVRPPRSQRRPLADPLTAEFTQNPFASTHSLDTNPFDDPSVKTQDLDRRERDLERREQQLNEQAEHIRKHGRSNWPPCPYFSSLSRSILMYFSLPSHLPFHLRRDP